MYRKADEVIGYKYDADQHCVECTSKRFNIDMTFDGGEISGNLEDSEGNSVYPIFISDEHNTPPCCGDCLELLD